MARRIAVLIAALALLAAGAQAADAGHVSGKQAYPDTFCRKSIHIKGQPWGVQGYSGGTIGCKFMRHWTSRWLRSGVEPPHYRCVDIGEGGTCDRHRSRVYFEYYIED
jgi:hypothetical protein